MGKIIGRRYRYNDDYKTAPRLDAKGRYDELIYIGKWINPLNGDAEYAKSVLLARIFVTVSVITVIAALVILPPPMSNKWYLPVLTTSVFPIAYEIMAAVALPSKRRPMERIKYDKSFGRLRVLPIVCFIIFGLTLIGVVVYWVLAAVKVIPDAPSYTVRDAAFVLFVLASAAANAKILYEIKKIKTETRENSFYRQ